MQPLRATAIALDHTRARILDLTLQVPLFRGWFTSRATRLLLQFIFQVSWQLPIAILFPVPVLILGPVLLGTAHLFATARHGIAPPDQVFPAQRKAVLLITAIWAAVGFARFFDGFENLLVFEVAGMALTLVLAWPLIRLPLVNFILCASLIGALGILAFQWPFHLTSVLVLGHHFVSMLHWAKAARSPRDRRTVAAAGALFVLVHVFIFFAPIEPWIGAVPFAGMDLETIGGTFMAWEFSESFVARAVVAYAFGQGMHYFVWLKCIPDQHHNAEVPTSFRQSLRLLEKDLGPRLVRFAALASVGMIGLAFFMESEAFRMVYFSAAAFHGFLEITTLFFPNRISSS